MGDSNKVTTYVIGIVTIIIMMFVFGLGVWALTIPSVPLAIISFIIGIGFSVFAYHDFKRIRDKEV